MFATRGSTLVGRPVRLAVATIVARCKSTATPAAAVASENIKTFKIYRWDPNVKVSHNALVALDLTG